MDGLKKSTQNNMSVQLNDLTKDALSKAMKSADKFMSEHKPQLSSVEKPPEQEVLPNSDMRALSFGEKAVGLTFNPSGDNAVRVAKETFAYAIDQLNYLRMNTTSAEVKRMCSVAITETQTAQMWAVKAITWKD